MLEFSSTNGVSWHERAKQKVMPDYTLLARRASAHRVLGKKRVLTIGSWDMLHIGHARYLLRAWELSENGVLIVGVDSDRAVKKYKGALRPMIPQEERIEMLTYLWFVDYVAMLDDVDERGHWQYGLVKAIRPDVFVAVEGSYSEKQREMIKRYSGELNVLPRQAENTSTSGFIQSSIKGHIGAFLDFVEREKHE